MGLLVNGEWQDHWYDTTTTGGHFARSEAQFRHWITPDGSAGPSGDAGFKAEPGRYHLYVSLACPWAHRALIFRVLKGLDAFISVSVVNPLMKDRGWTFDPAPGVIPDAQHQARYLYQLYNQAAADYSGRVTVPILWDKQRDTIVSNESADIIRMFNSAFDAVGAVPGDFYPAAIAAEIDSLNAQIYDTVNNGVYKTGFATTQAAYEDALYPLFDTLEQLELRLSQQRYLLGSQLTEADWRLFTTLIRFDAVYYGHFKCNLKQITDYPNLWGYLRELYQWPGISATVDMQHIKIHYYASHDMINPTGVVPAGPLQDLDSPHGRDHLHGAG